MEGVNPKDKYQYDFISLKIWLPAWLKREGAERHVPIVYL